MARTPLANTLAIDGEFLSCSVDAGFILMLPLHHGDLENCQCRNFDKELPEDHVAFLVAWPQLVGPIRNIKIPVQELWLKM